MMTAVTVAAQDVIVKRDRSTILAKVLKITQSEVEYKKASNIDGPTYSISKNDVLAINYENGECDTFDDASKDNAAEKTTTSTVTPTETAPTISHNYASQPFSMNGLAAYQEKEDLLRSARTNKTWGTVCFVVGVGTGLAGLLLSEGIFDVIDPTTSYVMAGGMGVLFIAGGILHGIAKRQRAQANSIRVASLIEKDIKINDNTSISPSLVLMANSHNCLNERFSIGVGTKITF